MFEKSDFNVAIEINVFIFFCVSFTFEFKLCEYFSIDKTLSKGAGFPALIIKIIF